LGNFLHFFFHHLFKIISNINFTRTGFTSIVTNLVP
jgi:hypothetical protein